MSGHFMDSKEAIKDIHLIQFFEVIGSLPEVMFRAWEHGELYFAQDRAARRSEMLADGEDGTWDFIETDDYDDIEGNSESGEEEDDGKGGGGTFTRRDNVELEEADDHEDDAGFDILEAWPSISDEEPLNIMAPCRSLEERSADKKPQNVDEVEEQQTVHLLRWIFQYDAAARLTAEEILDRPWFQAMG